MDFKGQQHSDVMRFFFKLTADFQKNFLHFVKGNSIVFLERMKNQKAKLDLLSKLIKKDYFIIGTCSLLTYVPTLLRAPSLAGG